MRISAASSGVLVFVVPARHEVVVLWDEGAESGIDGSVWHDVAPRIARAFARGDWTVGLVDGVDRLAHALSASFPREPGATEHQRRRASVSRTRGASPSRSRAHAGRAPSTGASIAPAKV